MFVFEGSKESVREEVEVLRSHIAEAGGIEVERERSIAEWKERF